MTHNLKSDFFELFGLPKAFHQDSALIKTRLYQLQQRVHPDNYINATPHEKRLAIEYAATVNEAYRVLECPLKRAVYLLKLDGIDALNETDTSMPADFLMQQMDLRERIDFTHQNRNDLPQLEKEIEAALIECKQRLSEYLDNHMRDLYAARLWVRKMQFYVRLEEELAIMTVSFSKGT